MAQTFLTRDISLPTTRQAMVVTTEHTQDTSDEVFESLRTRPRSLAPSLCVSHLQTLKPSAECKVLYTCVWQQKCLVSDAARQAVNGSPLASQTWSWTKV